MPRIPVETKHTYMTYSFLIGGADHDSPVAQEYYNEDRPLLVFSTPTYPVTGPEETQRVGRKIRSESLVEEYFITLFNTLDNHNFNTVYDYYMKSNSDMMIQFNEDREPTDAPNPFNSNEQALDVSIRHLMIELDTSFFSEPLNAETSYWKIFDLFREGWIHTGNTNLHSNRQQVKKVSTEFTGAFNIIYDKVIHLSLSHPVYHGNVTVPYVRHLNFDGTETFPTNKIVLSLFVGPTNIWIDYGSYALGQCIENYPPDGGPNIIVGEISTTLKLNYTDM